jgi:SAM-dependent methyltransferase
VTTPDDGLLLSRSFGAAAQEYARSRPSYPDAAVDWLLPAGARTVLDLGAGTGQLTRQLVRRGLDVVAVEPSDGMRAELAAALPDVPALAGSAEEVPLPDASVDAVLVAQAWHWVDVARAVPEVARVLVPGGRLGLLWNIRDEREDWTARLGALLHRGREQHLGSDSPDVGPPFSSIERLDVPWVQRSGTADLLDLVASRSYVITMPPDGRQALLEEVRALLDDHPALQRRDEVDLPYVTRCSRCDLSTG